MFSGGTGECVYLLVGLEKDSACLLVGLETDNFCLLVGLETGDVRLFTD